MLTGQESGDGQMYGDGLLGDFIWACVEDLLAHVAVCRLAAEGLVGAGH